MFPQYQIDSTARCQRKGRLIDVAGHRRIRMRSADQKFSKGHKAIKLPQIQPWSKQVGPHTAINMVGAIQRHEVPVESGSPEFRRQAQPVVGIKGERPGGAVVIEVIERIAWPEIYVLV